MRRNQSENQPAAEIITARTVKISKESNSDIDIDNRELSKKLDILSDKVDHLIGIVLEDHRILEKLKTTFPARSASEVSKYLSGFKNNSRFNGEQVAGMPEIPPGSALANQPGVPFVSQLKTEEAEIEGALSREERIRQYEEKNPW